MEAERGQEEVFLMNYNNSATPPLTSATPPLDVLKILTLQRRDAVLEAIEEFYKQKDADSQPPIFFVTSRVRSLFLDLEPMLRRYYAGSPESKKRFQEMEEVCFGVEVYDCINMFREMCSILDEKNLTKWDNQKIIDTTLVESENEEKGL